MTQLQAHAIKLQAHAIKKHDRDLADQLRRAATSVSLNLGEAGVAPPAISGATGGTLPWNVTCAGVADRA